MIDKKWLPRRSTKGISTNYKYRNSIEIIFCRQSMHRVVNSMPFRNLLMLKTTNLIILNEATSLYRFANGSKLSSCRKSCKSKLMRMKHRKKCQGHRPIHKDLKRKDQIVWVILVVGLEVVELYRGSQDNNHKLSLVANKSCQIMSRKKLAKKIRLKLTRLKPKMISFCRGNWNRALIQARSSCRVMICLLM